MVDCLGLRGRRALPRTDHHAFATPTSGRRELRARRPQASTDSSAGVPRIASRAQPASIHLGGALASLLPWRARSPEQRRLPSWNHSILVNARLGKGVEILKLSDYCVHADPPKLLADPLRVPFDGIHADT